MRTISALLGLNLVLLSAQLLVSEAHDHHRNDPYSPIINFLKDLRKARKYGSLATGGIRDGQNSGSGNSNINSGSGNSNINSGSGSNSDSIRVGISDGGSGSSNNNNNNNGNNNNNNDNTRAPFNQAQLEQALQQAASQLPTQPPYDLRKVNTGVSTILGGVGSGSLAEILRGAFTFTRNDNVASVANTAIDSIFGTRDGKGGWAGNLQSQN